MIILDENEVAAVRAVLRSVVDHWPQKIAQLHDVAHDDARHMSRRLLEAEFLLQKLEAPAAEMKDGGAYMRREIQRLGDEVAKLLNRAQLAERAAQRYRNERDVRSRELDAERAQLVTYRPGDDTAASAKAVAMLTDQLADAVRELVTVRQLLKVRDEEIEKLRGEAPKCADCGGAHATREC